MRAVADAVEVQGLQGSLTTYSSSYPSSSGTPVLGSQSRTVNFMVQLKVPATGGKSRQIHMSG